jgi:hypothetical protein
MKEVHTSSHKQFAGQHTLYAKSNISRTKRLGITKHSHRRVTEIPSEVDNSHYYEGRDCIPVRGGVRSTRGLGSTMTTRGQSIGISFGILGKLIRTNLGLKRGAPSGAGPGAVAPLATPKRRL